jgi:cyclohexanone monooxygenase
VEEIIRMSRFSESYQSACTPGYYNNEGKPSQRSKQNGSYGAGPTKFFRLIKAWREEGGMQGLELR